MLSKLSYRARALLYRLDGFLGEQPIVQEAHGIILGDGDELEPIQFEPREDALVNAARDLVGDDETAEIIAGIAGVLAGVARADRTISTEEQKAIRAALGELAILDAQGVHAVMWVLSDERTAIGMLGGTRYARLLAQRTDRETRMRVLVMMLEIAGADDAIDDAEIAQMRRLTHALALNRHDYAEAQAPHRDKLSARAGKT